DDPVEVLRDGGVADLDDVVAGAHADAERGELVGRAGEGDRVGVGLREAPGAAEAARIQEDAVAGGDGEAGRAAGESEGRAGAGYADVAETDGRAGDGEGRGGGHPGLELFEAQAGAGGRRGAVTVSRARPAQQPATQVVQPVTHREKTSHSVEMRREEGRVR